MNLPTVENVRKLDLGIIEWILTQSIMKVKKQDTHHRLTDRTGAGVTLFHVLNWL